MTTAAYDAQADAFSKQVQWLVEIDLDRCSLQYTDSPCTASDQGDGSRCYYSFATCQDAANYAKTTRTYRFCLNDVPWPDNSVQVWPLLKRHVSVPQKIDPSKLFVFPEVLRLTFILDHLPPVPDSDKTATSGLYNTTKVGEFWHNLFARNRNYPGRPVRIYRGFNAAGFTLSDFDQIGPTYTIKSVQFRNGECRMEAESPLADLNKREIPFAISEDNTLQNTMTDSQTTVDVLDASEYPDPTDYSRNTCYVEVEDEIMSYTGRDTGSSPNQLTGLTRGAFGTTGATHTDLTQIVRHVACFGTTTGGARNSLEIMQDLLEWGDIAAADVDTSKFDDVKASAWPNDDCLRVVRDTKKIAKLMQQLREVRGIVVFLDSAGKWAAEAMGPDQSSIPSLNDEHFIEGSVIVHDDEEERLTRVALFYDPIDDDANDPEEFRKSVIVINTDLEGTNNFAEKRSETLLDKWIDPSTAVAKVRDLARRRITRLGYGIRTISFDLDVKEGELNVGSMRTATTRHLLDINGNQDARPVMVTKKDQRQLAVSRYQCVDTNYSGRYLRFGPDSSSMTEDYDSATTDDKSYGYWGDTDNRVGAQKEPGYIFW